MPLGSVLYFLRDLAWISLLFLIFSGPCCEQETSTKTNKIQYNAVKQKQYTLEFCRGFVSTPPVSLLGRYRQENPTQKLGDLNMNH